MQSIGPEQIGIAIGYFVPVELQRRQFHLEPVLTELVRRSFKPLADSEFQQVQPWCKWRAITTYLDCLAFADRAANGLPKGAQLSLEHVTPGQFYSAGAIFFAQAMIDNIAVWLCEAHDLQVSGGERNFLKKKFTWQLIGKHAQAEDLMATHSDFLEEVNRYRQVWIHTLAGGVIPIADGDPFSNPLVAKFLGVPIDPAINIDETSYARRIEQCATRNQGRYLYPLGEFTKRVFDGGKRFYLDWLRFSLDTIIVSSD